MWFVQMGLRYEGPAAGGVSLEPSDIFWPMMQVKGQKSSHLVLAHGLYCSCRDAYLFAIFGEVANVSLLGKG